MLPGSIIVSQLRRLLASLPARLRADPMLGQRSFRKYWVTATINSFGEHISSLALPLTAALLLHATPAQMGTLVALQALPFALFSLPAGVWLDRRRKYPILLWSEALYPMVLVSVPLGYWLGILNMPWMYAVGFLMGTGAVVNGGATQIFLTHLVGRDHLIDAHSKFAITDSAARLTGPGMGGLLIQALGAPFAVLVQAAGYVVSWFNLRTLKVDEPEPAPSDTHPLRDIVNGLAFVKNEPSLWLLAWSTALWQLLFYGAAALGVLFTTRVLGMSPGTLGMVQMLGGLGVFASSLLVKPLSARVGPGRTMLVGLWCTAGAWVLQALAPAQLFGHGWAAAAWYGLLVFLFDCGVMLFFLPYLALRQKLTPDAFLGRMVSSMRFITVASAPLGAMAAGVLAEQVGLRAGMGCIAAGAVLLALVMLFGTPLRSVRA